MSDQAPDDKATYHLGRGRGRGIVLTEPDTRAPSSTSTSEKRPGAEDARPQGNGQKRGMSRDNRSQKLYRTKPENMNSKQGTTGVIRQYTANYFKLLRKPNFEFVMYRVDFEPEIENVFMRKAFIGSQKELLGGYLFDGANIIYTTHKLPQDHNEFPIKSREGVDYNMIIKNTGRTISMTDDMATQILNLILRRTMEGLNMQLVGRNLYDAKSKIDLSEYRIELWPGYITSIRQHEHDILVCCEVSHKVMRRETVHDILTRCLQDDRNNFKENFKKEVIGTVVLTDYNKGGNSKTYRVDDVDFSKSPKSTFDMKGDQISFSDYFKNRYNIVIRDVNQPMLISNPKSRDIRAGQDKTIALVPELCRATGLTDSMRNNFQMMRGMAQHTQMDPERRKARLLALTTRWHQTPECLQKMNSFNTDIDRNLVSFSGRALPQEEMIFGNNKTFKNDDRVDWTNALKSTQMFASIPLKRWMLIYPKRSSRETVEFLELMRKVAAGMNYEMGEPKMIELDRDQNHEYVEKLKFAITKDPKLIMIVVPNNAKDRYEAIKKLTCVTNAVPTQVVVHKTMCPKKGNMAGVMSIATKVMIQINSKLGGAPWMVKFPLSGVMTIGFDVTHNTKNKSESFGAFVASMDLKKNVRYYSSVMAHRDHNEVASNMEIHLDGALRAYKNMHDALPERIFFYRDGVGEGDIKSVVENEVARIKEKLNAVYTRFSPEKEAKLSFIIVNKRINTRIFENDGKVRVKNPASGTVIDDVITLPERYDFFLVSQSVRQGTVSPTSYNVIEDGSGLPPDKMQLLTYKQCHLYYNWSGTVRVPAVVQYAHKLAFLVGEFLHTPPNNGFDNSLYFL